MINSWANKYIDSPFPLALPLLPYSRLINILISSDTHHLRGLVERHLPAPELHQGRLGRGAAAGRGTEQRSANCHYHAGVKMVWKQAKYGVNLAYFCIISLRFYLFYSQLANHCCWQFSYTVYNAAVSLKYRLPFSSRKFKLAEFLKSTPSLKGFPMS